MNMNPIPPLFSRQALYQLAWILFVASIVLPAPGGSFQGGAFGISGMYVVGKVVEWSDAFQKSTGKLGFTNLVVLTLALFSNVVFLFSPALRQCPRISWTSKVFLLTLLAINASLVFCFPVFASLPAYWLWLAAFLALTVALVALPGVGPMPPRRKAKRAVADGAVVVQSGEVPALIWAWLFWTLFWLGVTAIHHGHQSPPPGSATLASDEALMPTALARYVNDNAGLLPVADLERLNYQLEQFEQETSNQIAVAIYARAPQTDLEAFSIAVAERSRLGRKGLDNGAILFVFIAERSARLEVGYGLEGVLTDVQASRILDTQLAPMFARSAYVQGLDATLLALLESVRDAYQGGRMPGRLAVLRRQLAVELPKLALQAWPTVSTLDLQARLAIGFFGGLLGLGILDGGRQTWSLLRNLLRSARNLIAGRPWAQGTLPMRFESMWDTLKILAIVVGAIASAVGIVVIAGGGTFGGAGTLLRW